MIDIWNAMAVKNGFAGMFFVETLSGFQSERVSVKTDACFHFEPMWADRKTFLQKLLSSLRSPRWRNHRNSYSRVWKSILENEKLSPDAWAGAFVDWDNSPRKGKRGYMLDGADAGAFHRYLTAQLVKMKKTDCPVCIINAWNEWGEGAYLEPDMKNGYGYLESVKTSKEMFCTG